MLSRGAMPFFLYDVPEVEEEQQRAELSLVGFIRIEYVKMSNEIIETLL